MSRPAARTDLLPIDDALAVIAAHVTPPATESVPLEHAYGRGGGRVRGRLTVRGRARRRRGGRGVDRRRDSPKTPTLSRGSKTSRLSTAPSRSDAPSHRALSCGAAEGTSFSGRPYCARRAEFDRRRRASGPCCSRHARRSHGIDGAGPEARCRDQLRGSRSALMTSSATSLGSSESKSFSGASRSDPESR